MKDRMKSNFPDISSCEISCDGACVTIRYDNGTEVFVDAMTCGFLVKVKAPDVRSTERISGPERCEIEISLQGVQVMNTYMPCL